MTQSISQEAISATGLPGATAASRHAGATTSGAPTTGTFAVGDYVVDQTGAMYVCTVAGTPGTWQLSGVSVNENIAGKNFVINGGMDIWQRGTSFSNVSNGTYTADRWVTVPGTTSAYTVSQTTSGLTGYNYALRFQRNSGVTNTNDTNIFSAFETSNSLPLAGQTVTYSYWARAGSNFSASGNILKPSVQTGTGTDQAANGGWTGQTTAGSANNTLTTSWQKFSFSFSIASTATQVRVLFSYTPTGTAGANDYYDITGVQLEIAPQATPFSRAGGSIGGELALCQRYYQQPVSTASYQIFGVGTMYSATSLTCLIPLIVQMRIAPSVTFSANSNWNIQQAGGFAVTSLSAFTVTPTAINASVNTSISLLSGGGGILISNGSGAAIYITAEL